MLALNELKVKQLKAHEEFLKQELSNPKTAAIARTKLAEFYDTLLMLDILSQQEAAKKFDELYDYK